MYFYLQYVLKNKAIVNTPGILHAFEFLRVWKSNVKPYAETDSLSKVFECYCFL